MSFLPFVRRWFGAKSPAIRSQTAKPDPDAELLDRTEVLLEDLNDFQENVAASLDSLPGAFLTKGGARTEENLDILTGGGDAGTLHTHANVPPVLSNAPPPAVAAASSAGTSVDAARADHTHASPPNPALATSAPPAVTIASSVGTALRAAREDHTHAAPAVPALSSTPPPPVAVASAAGTSPDAARADHAHGGLGSVLMWGNTGWGTGTNTKYADPFWTGAVAGTTPIQFRAPRAGTIRSLMLFARAAGSGSFVAHVRINDVATPLEVAVGSGIAQAENLSASLAVSMGDRIDVEIVRSVAGSPTDITITAELV